MEKVFISGRLTRDVEVRYSQGQNGQFATAKTSVAVDRGFGDNKVTDFHNLEATGKIAEFMEKYCFKGKKYLFEGELRNNNYEKDGVKHYGYVVHVNNVEFCNNKDNNSAPAPIVPEANDGWYPSDQLDEELPFA